MNIYILIFSKYLLIAFIYNFAQQNLKQTSYTSRCFIFK